MDADPDDAYHIATTVAHELGHNIGMNHDEDEPNCTCPDPQNCIMTGDTQTIDPVRFAKCSVDRFMDLFNNGLSYCMTDRPQDLATVNTRTACGNRIVETGEDCDCGPEKFCNNSCCNPKTCKFTTGASCASGECCDPVTCNLVSEGTVCRTERSVCDLPEYCNGKSEWCPSDDYKVDGTECLSGKAYCYKGRCDDRDSRCKSLIKNDGVTAAPASWSVLNAHGKYGYCGYKAFGVAATPQVFAKYCLRTCSAANQRCGLLFCVKTNKDEPPKSNWWNVEDGQIRYYPPFDHDGVFVNQPLFVRYDLTFSGYRDPGMVPNGAECGNNMMCVDSECIPTARKVACPNCNGHGVCTQGGLCFCERGFRPPDCLQPGGGGSMTNQLPYNVPRGKKSASLLAAFGYTWRSPVHLGPLVLGLSLLLWKL